MNSRNLILALASAVLVMFLQTGDAACIEPWVSGYVGNCYLFGHQQMDWYTAQSLCRSLDGKLVEVYSEEENAWLVNEIKERNMGNVWMGSTDMFQEGYWRWTNDRSNITMWHAHSHQPDNHGGLEHCLEFRLEYNYGWNDVPCDFLNNIICKQ